MSNYNSVVGEPFVLEGHCMVAHPDGTVVTSTGSYRFMVPGEYTVIYDLDADDVDTVMVTAPDAPESAPDDPAAGSSDGSGPSTAPEEKSPSTGDPGGTGTKD